MANKNILHFNSDINGFQPSGILFVNDSPAPSSTAVLIKSSDSATLAQFYEESDTRGILAIYDASGNQDVRLDTGGNSYFNGGSLGIGTTSPAQKLHVHVDSTGSSRIRVSNSTGVSDIAFHDSKLKMFDNAGTERFSMASGIFVIGGGTVTSPIRTLITARAGARGEIYLRDLNTGYSTGSNFQDGTYLASEKGKFSISGQSDSGSGSATAVLVDHSTSTIKVGINQTTPAYTLDVGGTINATGAITGSSTITTTGTATHGNSSNRLTFAVPGACCYTAQSAVRGTDGSIDPVVTNATFHAAAPVLSNGSVLDSVKVIIEVADNTDNVTVAVRRNNDGAASDIVAAATSAPSADWTNISGNKYFKTFDCSDYTITDGDATFCYITFTEADQVLHAVEFIYNQRKI